MNYAQQGMTAEFYGDGRLRRFGRLSQSGHWSGWMLELTPGMLGTARQMTPQGEQASEVWADGRAEFFGPNGEERPALMDWDDWVRGWVDRIASAPAPATVPSKPPAVSVWKKLRLALTLSLAASAK